MRRFAILLAVIVVVAVIAYLRPRATGIKLAEVSGGIGSLEGDRQVLAQMRQAGADLSKPTEVNFYLYFKDRAAAERALPEAGDGTLTASVRPGTNSDAWLCLVSGTMVPDEAAIHATVVRLLGLAQRYGGDYDGWEAAITQ
jgi:hypothetical protein